jgi:2-dehydropantoate 2-reductase
MIDASVLVVGGGAIGGITAARMTAEVRRVAILDTNEEHVARLRDPGLHWEEPDAEHDTVLEAATSFDELEGDFDLAILAVKSPFHEAACVPLAESGRIGAFSSIGNGLIQDRMEGYVGEGNLMAALVEWGGSNVGPGHLIADTVAGAACGELDGSVTDRVKLLHACLAVGCEAHLTENIRGKIWSKLLLNTAYTGLSAVSGLRYGEVADLEIGRTALYAIWGEGVRVGRAEGLQLERVMDADPQELVVDGEGAVSREDADATVERMMKIGYRTRPSMLQDLDAGRTTEVDVVNGGVAGRGRELGIPTPLNDGVVALVHAMERGERKPDPSALTELNASRS